MSDTEQKYGTIQVRMPIKKEIVKFCNANNHRIGKFVEGLFEAHVSSSTPVNVQP